jgi:hypothetical protein
MRWPGALAPGGGGEPTARELGLNFDRVTGSSAQVFESKLDCLSLITRHPQNPSTKIHLNLKSITRQKRHTIKIKPVVQAKRVGGLSVHQYLHGDYYHITTNRN